MAANNYYLGIVQGVTNNIDSVQATSSVNAGPGAGTAADVEVRIQTDPGSGPNSITRKQVVECLTVIIEFINSQNPSNAGANLPAL